MSTYYLQEHNASFFFCKLLIFFFLEISTTSIFAGELGVIFWWLGVLIHLEISTTSTTFAGELGVIFWLVVTVRLEICTTSLESWESSSGWWSLSAWKSAPPPLLGWESSSGWWSFSWTSHSSGRGFILAT